MLKEMQAKITVVESKKDWAQFNRQSPTDIPNKTRSAYIASFAIDGDAGNLRDVIVVHDTRTDKFYEIRGLKFRRPFENIFWQSNDVLVLTNG